MNEFQILKSQKNNNKKIIYKGYIHNFDKKYENFISFRCVRRDCLGRLRTNIDMTEILTFKSHYHEEEKSRLVKLKNNIILKNDAENTNNDFHETLNKILIEGNEEEKSFVGKYDSMRDYFIKLRNRNKFPVVKDNKKMLELYKYTLDGELFLQYYNNSYDKNECLLFSTDRNLQILRKSNLWMSDGTFYSSPKEYSQVYIIYCNAFGKIIPTIYILMKSKSENAYSIVFNKIKELTNSGPKMILIDFETSVYNAISNVFPEVEIRGCNFHLNQIVVRFMNEKKIIENYKKDLNFKKYVKYLLILAYVPESSVENEYNKIKGLKKDKYEYTVIDDFFSKNFIYNNTKIKNKNFWSVNTRIIENLPTTTNSCEAYHKHLNSKVNKKKPH
ncbi:hypothetical protein DMUE_4566 [Dictyocoela muelleri]|nr:hypothetical protein DMUE_4566 [Dictyocoela muelleri]